VHSSIESRIVALARRDRLLAVTFTVLMWVVLVFVLVVASAVAPSPGIVVALVVSLLLLGGFNTASMLALVRRYAADKDLIYRPDIVTLDRIRSERERGRA
jgi:hypothetical protein